MMSETPVIAGESFRVQYVLDDDDKETEFFQPDFKSLKVINGPYINYGTVIGPDGTRKIRNIVYTLVAPKSGKFIIPGANAKVKGKIINSGNVLFEVLSKAAAFNMGLQVADDHPNQDYFLRPGEDPKEKIRRNLFIKVSVDKKSCYVGEPVTAVFKLYSRLESRSDIVKNPGFYGFTVQDMIGLNDRIVASETINGKRYDVHTVRKVQLYPLRAGTFSVDPMEVENKVEFSKSAVSRKTEQEIEEGIFSDDYRPALNTEVYESSMSTRAVTVTVKPLPTTSQPETFNGATGKYSIIASVDKQQLKRNEEGVLTVTIRGKGNFTQLAAPTIEWPKGIEGFDPSVKDSLDNTHAPLNGSRVFQFRFVSAKAGKFILPGIKFSFFDPDSNSYKLISTRDTIVTIGTSEKEQQKTQGDGAEIKRSNRYKNWWLGGIVAVFLIGGIVLMRRMNSGKSRPLNNISPVKQSEISISELLAPVTASIHTEDKNFYALLRNAIWSFFGTRFGLSGSGMNKHQLSGVLTASNVPASLQLELFDLLSNCEAGIFTSANTGEDKSALIQKTMGLLEGIEQSKASA